MLELRLLGGTEARIAGRLVDLGGPKQRHLLALLILADGGEVSIDSIGDALWPDRKPKNLRASIQVYVHQLRHRLDDESHELLQTASTGYRISIEDSAVDLRVFDRLVSSGLDALSQEQPSIALRDLDEAIGMTRGNPLPDLLYAPFARDSVTYYEQRRLAALESRLEARLALGLHREVITETRRFLVDNPFHEALWEALMLALYRAGRRTEALRSYQIAINELAEAGLEPTTNLRELESKILAQDQGLLLETHGPPTNIKEISDPAEHRELLDRVVLDLRSERSVALIGSLPIAEAVASGVARTLLPKFEDGAWIVHVGLRTDRELLAHQVLDVMGILPGPDPKDALASYLEQRTAIFALVATDMDEGASRHFVAEVAWLNDCLERLAPASRLLIALPRHIDGVHALARSITSPTPLVATSPADPTTVLLGRLAVFSDAVTLDAIRRVAGFPPIEVDDVDYLLGQLIASGAVVADNSGSITRFAPIADLSPERSTIAERDLDAVRHRHLSYCCDLAADVVKGLDGPGRREALARASAEHREFRLAIGMALDVADVGRAALIAHAAGRYWAGQGSHLGLAISTLTPLSNQLSEASANGAGVLLGLGFAHFRSGAFGWAGQLFDRAIEMALAADDQSIAGVIHVERGHLRMFRGDRAGAASDYAQAGAVSAQVGSPALWARVLLLRAQLELRAETEPSARLGEQLDEAAQVFERLGHLSGEVNSLLVKASWHIDRGDKEEAITVAGRGLDIAQIADDRAMLAFALVRSSEALCFAGQRQEAETRAIEALKVSIETGNWLVGSLALLVLGASRAEMEPGQAADSIRAFGAIRRELGVPATAREIHRATELGVDLTDFSASQSELAAARELARNLVASA